MELRIIAVIQNRGNTVGYRLVDQKTGNVADLTIDKVYWNIKHFGCVNAEVTKKGLEGTECNLNRLTIIDTQGAIVVNKGYSVINRIESSGETKGYCIMSVEGKKVNLRKKEALEVVKKFGVTNATIVEKEGCCYLRGIKKDIMVAQVVKETEKRKDNRDIESDEGKKKSRVIIVMSSRQLTLTNKVVEVITLEVMMYELKEETLTDLRNKEYKNLVTNIDNVEKSAIISTECKIENIVVAVRTLLGVLNELKLSPTSLVYDRFDSALVV